MYRNANIVVSDGMFWDIPALICGPLHMLFSSPVPLYVVKQHPKFLTPSEGKCKTSQANNSHRKDLDVN